MSDKRFYDNAGNYWTLESNVTVGLSDDAEELSDGTRRKVYCSNERCAGRRLTFIYHKNGYECGSCLEFHPLESLRDEIAKALVSEGGISTNYKELPQPVKHLTRQQWIAAQQLA